MSVMIINLTDDRPTCISTVGFMYNTMYFSSVSVHGIDGCQNLGKNFECKGFLGSERIVLSHEDKFFTLELNFKESGCKVCGKMAVYPLTRVYEAPKEILERCGEVTESARVLLTRGCNMASDFGHYNMVFNNCQNFCNKYLDHIGLGQQKKPTDLQKGLSWLGTVAGAAMVMAYTVLSFL